MSDGWVVGGSFVDITTCKLAIFCVYLVYNILPLHLVLYC